jgi:hypothetical protein
MTAFDLLCDYQDTFRDYLAGEIWKNVGTKADLPSTKAGCPDADADEVQRRVRIGLPYYNEIMFGDRTRKPETKPAGIVSKDIKPGNSAPTREGINKRKSAICRELWMITATSMINKTTDLAGFLRLFWNPDWELADLENAADIYGPGFDITPCLVTGLHEHFGLQRLVTAVLARQLHFLIPRVVVY